jgi:hypothetical protein
LKKVTIAIQSGDTREAEVRRFLNHQFPGISEIEFQEGDVATPRAVRLSGATEKLELMDIDSALFRYFNEEGPAVPLPLSGIRQVSTS